MSKGWVTIGRIHVDLESQTETFTRITKEDTLREAEEYRRWIAKMRSDLETFGCIFPKDAQRLLRLLEESNANISEST